MLLHIGRPGSLKEPSTKSDVDKFVLKAQGTGVDGSWRRRFRPLSVAEIRPIAMDIFDTGPNFNFPEKSVGCARVNFQAILAHFTDLGLQNTELSVMMHIK